MFLPERRYWPNLLTAYRILAVPLFAYLWSFETELYDWINFGIYSLACISDYLDGWLARRDKRVSNFGKMLDPISDKIMVMAVLLLMVADRTIYGINLIPAMLILVREVGVSGLREFLSGINVRVPVSRLAKWKTMVQMLALGFLIVGIEDLYGISVRAIGLSLLWLAAGLTLITGYNYLKKTMRHVNLDPLKDKITRRRRKKRANA
ncbi:MAG: CDP-diacylglycerol--glycerol-3-phosphate 3-phosphatidyltransferase [Alphaproteobacteria bacterium]|nr:CDP-diacylglycerol--glycerol-3-phosphate 3-phosphatidyltransferase [Alphaproteobacteria bacterium]